MTLNQPFRVCLGPGPSRGVRGGAQPPLKKAQGTNNKPRDIQINDINDSPPSIKLIPSEYIYVEDLLKLKVGQKLLEFAANDLDDNSNLSFKILPKSSAISTEILEFGVHYREKKEGENENENNEWTEDESENQTEDEIENVLKLSSPQNYFSTFHMSIGQSGELRMKF